MLRVLLSADQDGRAINAFDGVFGWTPLHYAIKENKIKAVELLIDLDADVDAHDEFHAGNTPLAKAVEDGHEEIVRLLIKAKADPFIEGWVGLTAVHHAQERALKGNNRESGRRMLGWMQMASQLPADLCEQHLLPEDRFHRTEEPRKKKPKKPRKTSRDDRTHRRG